MMSQEHPELIFVAGPQAGQRVVLSRPVAVLGRGGDADVMLSEEFASRLQARYELLRAGPTLENISARNTWINGKRYKAGRKVILETGDLIGAGKVTQILFVAAGDDVETALATYQASIGTGKDAFGHRAQVQEPPGEPSEPEPPPEPPSAEDRRGAETPQEAKPKRTSEMSAGEHLEVERRERRRKIAIGLGIYLGAFVVVATILVIKFGGGENTVSQPVPRMMTDDEIAEAVRAPVQGLSINRVGEKNKLAQAVSLYEQYGLNEPYHLYDCVRAFKEALAHSGRGFFENPEHGKIYQQVLDELIKVIQHRYTNAYIIEKAKEWEQAENEFSEILMIFRDPDSPLTMNVRAHYKRVKRLRQQKEPTRRTPWS